MSLTTLAPELVEFVLFHLSKKDLRNLSLTCRAMRCYAQACLFGNLTMIIGMHSPGRFIGFTSVLGTLRAAPHLADAVRRIELSFGYFSAIDAKAKPELKSGVNTSLSRAECLELEPLKTLLQICLYVRRLRVESRLYDLLWGVDLGRLKQLELHSEYRLGEHRTFDSEGDKIIFKAIKNCHHLEDLNVVVSQYSQFPAVGCLGNLQSITLRQSFMDPEALEKTLEAAPGLRTLRYDMLCDIDTDRRYRFLERPHPVVDARKLGAALRASQHSLHCLHVRLTWLDTGHCNIRDGNIPDLITSLNWGLLGSLGSLDSFRQLKTIELPIVLLLGFTDNQFLNLADLLPQSLQQLHLHDDLVKWERCPWTPQKILAQIGGLLEQGEAVAPSLHTVIFTLHNEEYVSRLFGGGPGSRYWIKSTQHITSERAYCAEMPSVHGGWQCMTSPMGAKIKSEVWMSRDALWSIVWSKLPKSVSSGLVGLKSEGLG